MNRQYKTVGVGAAILFSYGRGRCISDKSAC